MKKYLLSLLSIAMAAFISFNLVACGDDDEDALGSIYGIVTELGTAEPMKAIGVELYKGGSLLLKTVTFDDGHFEFNDLLPGNYKVNVVADGYNEEEGDVIVEAGRQARIDLQIRKMKTHMVVRTTEATINGTKVTLSGEYTYENGYAPSEVGILYATYNNPKNGGILVKCKLDNNTKKLSTTIDELEKGTYYYQAYAKNSVGTAYGDVRSFKMSNAPIVTTLPPTNVLATTATLNGRIDAEGDPAYTERGFVYSKSYNMPTIGDPANATTRIRVSGRNKEFSANISSLTENVTYYVRAYAVYEDGISYGEALTFKFEHPDYIIFHNLMIQKEDLSRNVNMKWSTADTQCRSSRIAGFSDWRLPTLDELQMMYSERSKIPNLSTKSSFSTLYTYWYYWSSDDYYSFCFYDGDIHYGSSGGSIGFCVRAVRTIK